MLSRFFTSILKCLSTDAKFSFLHVWRWKLAIQLQEFCWLHYNWLKYTHWTAKVLRWDMNSDFWDINCMKVFIGPTVYMTAILVSKAILYNIADMIVCMFIAVLLEILQFVSWVRNGSCSEEVYLDVVNKPVTNLVISVTTSVNFFLSWSHFLLF